MRASVIISALVAVLVGFGGSVAVVLAAAQALNATPEQTSSWVAGLCLSIAIGTAVLSVWHRLPIVMAWSTPGAALIATTTGITMPEAVGAFLLSAALIVLTSAFRPLETLIQKIPTSVASAMLAGVLFGFVIAIFKYITDDAALVVPMLLLFVVLRVFSPAWAVLAVLALGVALAIFFGEVQPIPELSVTSFVWITPVFDTAVLVGLGIPLYLVTMASQNLPGFAVLRGSDYPVPARSILSITGGLSVLTAPLGAHTSNLAAIIAAICTGPDAHPDKEKRWLCGAVYAAGYAILTIFGAAVVALFSSLPEALIVAVAGIALSGPLLAALTGALAEEKDRFAAIATFAVTASGMTAFGIGAAFWGLVAGLFVVVIERVLSR